MALKIKIRENTLEHIHESDMFEGIDLLPGRKVAYNPKHSQYVDTREQTMLPIERKIKIRVLNTDRESTYPVISIFGRNSNDNNTRNDGNPLVYALKEENGWSFRSRNDKNLIIAQATKVAKNLFSRHHIDTIVFTPSTNDLNKQIRDIVEQACPQATMLPNTLFNKKKTKDVFNWLDYDWIRYILGHYYVKTRGWKRDDPRWDDFIDEQKELMSQYADSMGDTFTYHKLPMEYRKAIPQSAEVGDICEYDVMLNDMDVAIIDDTLTTGKTLSDISELILKSYAPKSITFITMFSAKDSIDLDTEVPTSDWKSNLPKRA